MVYFYVECIEKTATQTFVKFIEQIWIFKCHDAETGLRGAYKRCVRITLSLLTLADNDEWPGFRMTREMRGKTVAWHVRNFLRIAERLQMGRERTVRILI